MGAAAEAVEDGGGGAKELDSPKLRELLRAEVEAMHATYADGDGA